MKIILIGLLITKIAKLVKTFNKMTGIRIFTKSLVAVAADKGVILLSCGVRGNVIRFLPALTIPLELIDEGMAIVESSLTELVVQ